MARRRLGLFALAIGLAIVVAAQRLAPIGGPPLYDGVIVEAPYVWLSPPAGFSGGAQGVDQTIPVEGGQSPDIGVGTAENPPQAQLFAGAGFLNLPSGTTSIKVSIEPVAPASLPDGWTIAGNVYRFSVTNQAGQPVTGQASGGVTIELRGPATLNAPAIEHFSGGKWIELAADSLGRAEHVLGRRDGLRRFRARRTRRLDPRSADRRWASWAAGSGCDGRCRAACVPA